MRELLERYRNPSYYTGAYDSSDMSEQYDENQYEPGDEYPEKPEENPEWN